MMRLIRDMVAIGLRAGRGQAALVPSAPMTEMPIFGSGRATSTFADAPTEETPPRVVTAAAPIMPIIGSSGAATTERCLSLPIHTATPMIGSAAQHFPTKVPTPSTCQQASAESVCTASAIEVGKRQHGRLHAELFAAAFVEWLRAHGRPHVRVYVGHLIELAKYEFAPAAGMILPPERSLLAALKRLPGVSTRANVRVRDRVGETIGKTTIYSFEFAISGWETADEAPDVAASAARRAA